MTSTMLRFHLLFFAVLPALVAQVPSPAQMPAMWSQRLTPRQRDEAVRATSVTIREDIVKKTEDAVVRGIDWLLKQQNNDGSWGTAAADEQIVLALLAIMGSGNFPLIKERDQAVRRAVSWLVRKRGEVPGAFEGKSQDPLFHAIATLALLEYQTLSGDRSLENDLVAALERIVSKQNVRGGWQRTDIKDFEENEPCLAAWNLLALQQAAALKTPVNGLLKALATGAAPLAKGDVWRPPGSGMRMRLDFKTGRSTEIGPPEPERPRVDREWGGTIALGRLLLRQKLQSAHPDTLSQPWDAERLMASLWWGITIEAFGKGTAQRWHQKMRYMLLDSQLPDGSWPPQGKVHDLFKPHEFGPDTPAGRVCRTALAVLLLESPYRVRLVTPPR